MVSIGRELRLASKLFGRKFCLFCRRRLSYLPTEQGFKGKIRYQVYYCDTCNEKYEIQLRGGRGALLTKVTIEHTTLNPHLQSYLRPTSIKERV